MSPPQIPLALFWQVGWGCLIGFLITGCAPTTLSGPIPLGELVKPLLPSPKPSTLFVEPFDALDTTRWREVEVRGRTQYAIDELDGSRVLKASSHPGASILLCPFRFDPDTYEWLSWRWRVDRLLEREDLTRKEGSDAVARVYVYFETPGLPWQKRSLDYVWSAHLPIGTIVNSAFSNQSKIIVVDSGPEQLGTWQTVHRNIEEDYKRCFGQNPPYVVAIGLMTDADNTHSEAVAYFDDLMITRQMPPAP